MADSALIDNFVAGTCHVYAIDKGTGALMDSFWTDSLGIFQSSELPLQNPIASQAKAPALGRISGNAEPLRLCPN